jgi:hypothetical protein
MTSSRAPITLPDWLNQWPVIAGRIRVIEAHINPIAEDHVILQRLATDDRMAGVYQTLMQRNRQKDGFVYPAKQESSHLSVAQPQEIAIAETLFVTFNAARDQMRTMKENELQPEKTKRLQRAAILREIADELFLTAKAHSRDKNTATAAYELANDGAALRRVADWQEHQLTYMRSPDDPLTIRNDRGDPVVRGVGIVVASFLKKRFGNFLYETAATLTSVALAQDANERAIRSAFSDAKTT